MGETFDNILNQYQIDKKEIQNLKNKLIEKINLNKLNTNQKIYLTIDQSTNRIKEFILKISNKERILLTRNEEKDNFDQEILLTKLDKKIIYQENIILQSLFKSATDKKIPANTIIELARIYGFQVDFQRDIRKQDRFQIMYEIFVDENKKIIETGNILFANLILSGEDNSLYYFFIFINEYFIHNLEPILFSNISLKIYLKAINSCKFNNSIRWNILICRGPI